MDYKINKAEKNVVKINITLSKEEWETEVEQAYTRTRAKYNVEGFRKGKAPRKVIEGIYGANVFYEEALSEGFYKAYMNILAKEPTLEPVDAPNINVNKVDADGVEIEATVVVKPEVKVKKYTGFDVELKKEKVTKEQLDAELDRVKEQNVRLVEVEREIKDGDIANINFSGSVDGVKFDGGTSEDYDLGIGSKSFIEGFEEQLIGLKAGEDKDVNVTFPKEYHVKELAGKPAVFACHVNAVKEKQYPELNDEFASNVSEYETMAEFTEHMKEHLQEHLDEHARYDAVTEIIDKIVENTEVEVPNQMVETELDNMMKETEYRLMYQGLNLEAYANYMNTTVEKLREDRRADALKSVKVRLALTYILDKEKITVTEAEVDEKVEEMAKSANKTAKEVKNSLSEDRLNYIKNDILNKKLIDFIFEKNVKKSK
ncbi:MAG TPA: trigger factor [Clostridiales bacterium]|nr:trigger factor [Clostridiales bacterium]